MTAHKGPLNQSRSSLHMSGRICIIVTISIVFLSLFQPQSPKGEYVSASSLPRYRSSFPIPIHKKKRGEQKQVSISVFHPVSDSRMSSLRSGAVFPRDDDGRTAALRSSWISRLMPHSPPPAAAPIYAPGLNRLNSFSNFRFFSVKKPPPPRGFNGFGPFHLGAEGNRGGGGVVSDEEKFTGDRGLSSSRRMEGSWDRSISRTAESRGVQLSPFFQYRLPPRASFGEENSRFMEMSSGCSSRNQNDSMSARNNGNSHALRRRERHWLPAGFSAPHVGRNHGSDYHGSSDDPSGYRTFRDHHELDDNSARTHSERRNLTYHVEAEEPFSFWNMGRFKRTNYVSSIPSANLALNRRRNPDNNYFIPSKYRRLHREVSQ